LAWLFSQGFYILHDSLPFGPLDHDEWVFSNAGFCGEPFAFEKLTLTLLAREEPEK
jgi:hypothetical protein